VTCSLSAGAGPGTVVIVGDHRPPPDRIAVQGRIISLAATDADITTERASRESRLIDPAHAGEWSSRGSLTRKQVG
jgi:hypothetical protein